MNNGSFNRNRWIFFPYNTYNHVKVILYAKKKKKKNNAFYVIKMQKQISLWYFKTLIECQTRVFDFSLLFFFFVQYK